MFQQKIRDFGGADRAHNDWMIHRRTSSTAEMKRNAREGYNLHRRNHQWWREVYNDAPCPTTINCFPSELYYDDKVDNDRKEMEIDGCRVNFDFNYVTTLKSSRKKPKAQPTAELLRNSNAPRITPQTHGSFVECVFSPTSRVTVLYASKDSDCPLLKQIYESAYSDIGKGMEEALNDNDFKHVWERDHHAGGKYAAFGIGSMDVKQGKPFVLKNHDKFEQSKTITQSLSVIISSVAMAVLNYVPTAFKHNENLKRNNEHFSYPPIRKQGWVSWFCNQIAVRRIGKGCTNGKEMNNNGNNNIVGLHIDTGDVSTMQPLVYIPRGGKKGIGGRVCNTELIVCEGRNGGKFVRIETNIPGYVCIVLLNSAESLHGIIEADDLGDEDEDAYCTRIVPFITQHILNYMMKNPGDVPIDKYEVI